MSKKLIYGIVLLGFALFFLLITTTLAIFNQPMPLCVLFAIVTFVCGITGGVIVYEAVENS